MRILAVDTGAKCGWALYDNGALSAGTWKLKKADTKKHKERYGMRFQRFYDELQKIGKVDYVYYEEVYSHTGTKAAHSYGGFKSLLLFWCELNGISYGSFGVGTIKKRATGKGNSDKSKMIKAANKYIKKILKREVTSDNEADAIWILQLAKEKHGV